MKVSAWSILALAAIFSLGIAMLAFELYGLQVEGVAKFNKQLVNQATRRMRKPGIRGRILDAKGGVLAESRARRDIVCDLSAFQKAGNISNTVAAADEAIAKLADALGFDRPSSLTTTRIARHVRAQSAVPMCVWRDLDEQSLARFAERADLPGLLGRGPRRTHLSARPVRGAHSGLHGARPQERRCGRREDARVRSGHAGTVRA